MESANDLTTRESEREEVLILQELPELGGTAHPDALGLTSYISWYNDCTGRHGSTGCL